MHSFNKLMKGEGRDAVAMVSNVLQQIQQGKLEAASLSERWTSNHTDSWTVCQPTYTYCFCRKLKLLLLHPQRIEWNRNLNLTCLKQRLAHSGSQRMRNQWLMNLRKWGSFSPTILSCRNSKYQAAMTCILILFAGIGACNITDSSFPSGGKEPAWTATSYSHGRLL